MEKPNQTVIGNAISAYFLFFVCGAFLWSKNPNIGHSFVKSHVKTAITLQILFICMLFIMSYPIGDSIVVIGYSVNTIIQIFLSLVIFSGLFYGAFRASKGQTISLGEMFHEGTGGGKELLSSTKTEEVNEENKSLLAMMHIPFLGFILYPSHKNLPRSRDIIQLNFLVSLIATCIYIISYANFAALIFLIYIIWSVFVSINMFSRDELLAPNMDKIPTVKEKIILQKSILSYLGNTFRKKRFVAFAELKKHYAAQENKREEQYKKEIQNRKACPLPTVISYVPFINIISLPFLSSQETYHIRYGVVITVISGLITYFYGFSDPLMLLVLFPICYGMGNLYKKEYIMPYFDELIRAYIYSTGKIMSIFKTTRKLQKTQIQETIKIGETQKES